MSQTRALSLVEVSISVAAGFVLSLAMQVLLFPVVGLQATVSQNLKLALGFTGLSVLRSYVVRRMFEKLEARQTPGGGSRMIEKIDPQTDRPACCRHGHNSDRGSLPSRGQ